MLSKKDIAALRALMREKRAEYEAADLELRDATGRGFDIALANRSRIHSEHLGILQAVGHISYEAYKEVDKVWEGGE